jgi:hypothetical protein
MSDPGPPRTGQPPEQPSLSQPVQQSPMPPYGPQPPPAQDNLGVIGGLASIVKSLSLTNVLIIALLVVIGLPTYVLWRAMNDQSMLNKFLSYYEEIDSDKVSCTLRVASQRGGESFFSISTGFAYQGNDRWTVGVILTHRPDPTELESYCATLNLIVDYMRRPNAKSPTYPNSDEPLIWQYQSEGSP